ncbi:metalloprotease [Brevundimonas denitrificans]|uniref:metalloprotease n=1 Tax=Brevundimonas denitrificans TaxID=1443434 RepID=UPI00223AD30E|nr:site-2 protease family protein [Brevundimonas denitrificans]
MSDLRPGPTNPAKVGPWGAVGDPAPSAARASTPARRVDGDENPGQNPVWALVSTALLAGLLWWLMGWVYALAGIVGLLVHEYGHVLAMNRLGMGPARIYIIPFLGGAAKGARGAASEWIGVLVSLAGPAFGLIAAIPFFAVWAVTGDPVWLQGAWFVALINLLNLAPAPPLDGSRALGPVLARVHPLLEKAALLGVGVLIVLWALSAAPTSSPSSSRSACSATCGGAPGDPTPPRSAGLRRVRRWACFSSPAPPALPSASPPWRSTPATVWPPP